MGITSISVLILLFILLWSRRLKTEEVTNGLRESERHLANLISNLPGVVYRCLDDENRTMLYLSNGCRAVTGYELDELIKNRIICFNGIIDPDYEQYVWDRIQNAVNANKSYTLEYKIIDKEGDCRWVWEKGAAFQKKNESRHHILEGFIQDITDQKEKEQQMHQQKKIAEQYLNHAGVMFIGLDTQGNVNLVNKKSLAILECTMPDIIGKNWFETFLPKDQTESVRNVFSELMKGNLEPVEYFENSVLSKTGNEKMIAWHNCLIKNDNGDISGTLGSGEDITRRKDLEIQLQHSQKLETIGSFAGGIAHDFNNILYPIIGFAEMSVQALSKTHPVRENLQDILAGAMRASELVEQLLRFSRQSDNENRIHKLKPLVDETVRLLRSVIPGNIYIETVYDDKDCSIVCNSGEIHEILLNLCSNACHSMEETGGIVSIILTRDTPDQVIYPELRDYCCICISDTGTGIPHALIEKVFTPYFTTKKQGKGSGLGLSVVHGIVNNYNGEISIDSKENEGTSVKVFLPVTPETDPVAVYEMQPSALRGDERILFVDDEEPIVKLSVKSLESLGYSVTGTASSSEAFSLFKSAMFEFDLVITDMTMPEMTGISLAMELMKLKPDIPVVLCSGFSEKINNTMLQKAGIKTFIKKPIIISELSIVIRDILDE